MSELQWIRPALLAQWPNLLEQGGVDFDKNGEISLNEKMMDYQRDGQTLGSDEDFWLYMSAHQEQISQHIDFVQAAGKLSLNNPLTNYLYANQAQLDYQHIYEQISSIITDLGQSNQRDRFHHLTEKSTYEAFSPNIKDEQLLRNSIIHELNIDLFHEGYNLGIDQYNENNYENAIQLFEKTLPLAESTERQQLIIMILFSAYYNQSIDLINKGNYIAARELIIGAQKYIETNEDADKLENLLGKTYRYEGINYFKDKDFAQAQTIYQEALTHLNNPEDIANCKNAIAACYYNLGNQTFSQGNYEQAIEIYQRAKDSSQDTDINSRADQQIARSYYNMAVEVNKSINTHDVAKYMLVKNLLETALAYANQDTLEKRINIFLEKINEILK